MAFPGQSVATVDSARPVGVVLCRRTSRSRRTPARSPARASGHKWPNWHATRHEPSVSFVLLCRWRDTGRCRRLRSRRWPQDEACHRLNALEWTCQCAPAVERDDGGRAYESSVGRRAVRRNRCVCCEHICNSLDTAWTSAVPPVCGLPCLTDDRAPSRAFGRPVCSPYVPADTIAVSVCNACLLAAHADFRTALCDRSMVRSRGCASPSAA